jgi:hypothetical protein
VRGSKEGVEKWLKGSSNLTVYEGHARFEDASQVRLTMTFSNQSGS